MGEFLGGADRSETTNNIDMGGANDNGYATDVEGVFANDVVKHGRDEFPCFDVKQEEFYQNMEYGRRRIRFSKDSNVQKYMQGSKYNRPFFIRHTDANGKQFVRKVK